MTEFLEVGGGVPFAELPAHRFMALPAGALAEFVPQMADTLHADVIGAFAHFDVEDFMAIEIEPEPIPWNAEVFGPAEVGRAIELSNGFSSKLQFLEQIDESLAHKPQKGIVEHRASQFVRDAAAIYEELVTLTARRCHWGEELAVAQQDALAAELSILDPRVRQDAWRFWNKLAIKYTTDKLERINDVLQQTAA